MSYQLLPNGKHKWDFRLGRKRVRHTDTDKKRGEKKVREMQVEYEHGSSEAYSNQTLHSILDGYLSSKLINRPHHKSYTLKSHIKCLKQLLPNSALSWFNQKDRPEYNAVSKWLEHYRDKAPAGNRKFNTLKAAFNWAIKNGYLSQNPCKRVSKLPHRKPFPRYLDRTEITQLFKASPRPQFSDYCFLILHTGLRPEEAMQLKWQDIDLHNKSIYILDQKNGDKDVVVIDDVLFDWFKERVTTAKDQSVLNNYTYGMLRADAAEAITKAGINKVIKPGVGKFTIYGLRHTFASHLLMAGEKIENVAKILRHKSLEMVYEHYGHLTKNFLSKTVNSINLTGHNLDTSNSPY